MYKNIFFEVIFRIYRPILSIADYLKHFFLFYMRLTWGYQFFLIGYHKLAGIQETIRLFSTVGIPQPTFHGYLVGWIECVFGFCLFIGFASRISSIPLIVILLVALSTVHAAEISEWRFLLEPISLVHQAPYPFLITCVVILIFGPGSISVDGWLKRFAKRQAKY